VCKEFKVIVLVSLEEVTQYDTAFLSRFDKIRLNQDNVLESGDHMNNLTDSRLSQLYQDLIKINSIAYEYVERIQSEFDPVDIINHEHVVSDKCN
jgi:hypothetical protein